MLYTRNADLVQDYADLGKPFVYLTACSSLSTPVHLLHFNEKLAQNIGLNCDSLQTPAGIQLLAGGIAWPNYSSVASVYCGHQFGSFVPQLGDGRALLISEVRNDQNTYTQLQLKGSGPTPFSRQGDGRAVLRSSIREYLASEAMHCLGIPTTRALSLVGSYDPVFRETTETAAVVCRTASSFLRFGHIEFFCYTNQLDALRKLLKWHITEEHPDIQLGPTDEHFRQGLLDFLKIVVQRTAETIAQWQSIGFCHGVMNTDNMSLLGLTIDYGPYSFMDAFNIDHICNHSDHSGRYSYRNQPQIGHWNLYALAQALSPLLQNNKEEIQIILDTFADYFHGKHDDLFSQKLGLKEGLTAEKKTYFIELTFNLLHEHRLDFTRFFRSIGDLDASTTTSNNWILWQASDFFPFDQANQKHVEQAQHWLGQWLILAQASSLLHTINPAFVLRNHLLQIAIEQCQQGNQEELNRLFHALSNPFRYVKDDRDLYCAPPPWAQKIVLSCSS